MRDKILFKDLRRDSALLPLNDLLENLGVNTESPRTVQIDNKYYTATLHCEIVSPEEQSPCDLADDHPYDGAVLVIDSSVSQQVASDVSAHVEKWAEAEISVIIVADQCTSKDSSLCHPAITRACLENQAEHIPLVRPLEAPDMASRGRLVEDQDDDENMPAVSGYCRIMSTLEAHMWENMEMKQAAPLVEPDPTLDSDGDDAIHAHVDPFGDDDINDPFTARGPSSSNDNDPLVANLLEGLLRMGQVDGEGLASADSLDDPSSGMDDPFAMGDIISQIRTLRDTAGAKSDAERREVAEKVAFAFLSAFCDDDDNGDGEGDAEGEDEESLGNDSASTSG